MGGKSLMLKITTLSILLSGILFSGSLSPTEISNMVAKIKEERVGISLEELESTANPFRLHVPKKKVVEVEKEEVVTEQPSEELYTLKSILNKAAFINTKWYKKGDTIGNYTVGYVSSRSVVLKSASGNKTLNLKKKKKMFIKLNRGYQ